MAVVTVAQLAEVVGTPEDRLLYQMREAGLPHSDVSDTVTDEQKQILLAHLKRSHGETDEAPRKITLKRKTVSTLKSPSAAGGRGRKVSVEVRKKRTYVRRETTKREVPDQPAVAATGLARLTEKETTKVAEEEARRREAHIEAEQKREEAAKRAAELKAIEEEKAKAEAEEQARRAQEAAQRAAQGKEKESVEESHISSRKDKRDRHDLDDEEVHPEHKKSRAERKRRFDFTEELLADDEVEPEKAEPQESTLGLSSDARSRRSSAARKDKRHVFEKPTEAIVREVEIGDAITVGNLAQKLSLKAAELITTLMNMGVMATINQEIDQETATLVVEELGHKVNLVDDNALEKELREALVYVGEDQLRAPVVTVMGHVDHGKTSLLDYIRSTHVAEREAGGITQHIGAYRCETEHGTICFIDTPGHAAFTSMRARGAHCTDIVILVVAADDGVMPQTEEAIQHAKAAGVPLVVAVNKIDKDGAEPERVKNELAAKDVIPDDWGGDTQFVPVSALTGEGVDDLLEAVLLQGELLELTAIPDGPGQGVVIESQLDKARGSVATLLVQNGTLKPGDQVVAGLQYGRVRALHDEDGNKVASAGPSTPVSVLGLNGTPEAGEDFIVSMNERKARELAQFRADKARDEKAGRPAANLDSFFDSFGEGQTEFLNIVVKTDVRGSLEALANALEELGNDEVKVKIVAGGVGGIAESDVDLALTSGAVLLGFNVRADSAAKKKVEREGLDLRYYNVIYELIDDVKSALSGMLAPEVNEVIVGVAEVRDVFQSKKFGQIAGCMVTEGLVSRNKKIRVLRDHVVIFEGELESLRHFKDEVEDIRLGTECGIGVKNYNDVRVGDQIEVFDKREVARAL